MHMWLLKRLHKAMLFQELARPSKHWFPHSEDPHSAPGLTPGTLELYSYSLLLLLTQVSTLNTEEFSNICDFF